MVDRLFLAAAMTQTTSANAIAFLQSLAAERRRLASCQSTLQEAIASSRKSLDLVEERIRAMEAVAEAYRSELPGDFSEDGAACEAVAPPAEIVIGPLRLHLDRRCAFGPDGEEIVLSNTQFRFLEIMALSAGKDVSRDELSRRMFGHAWNGSRNIDQIAFQTKLKLPQCGDGGELIRSVRGVGYWMRPPEQAAAAADDSLASPPEEAAPDGPLPEPAAEDGELPASEEEQLVRDETAARLGDALDALEGLPEPSPQPSPKSPQDTRWVFGNRMKKLGRALPMPAELEDEIRKFAQDKGITVCPASFAAETGATIPEADRKAIAEHAQRQEEARLASFPTRRANRKPA